MSEFWSLIVWCLSIAKLVKHTNQLAPSRSKAPVLALYTQHMPVAASSLFRLLAVQLTELSSLQLAAVGAYCGDSHILQPQLLFQQFRGQKEIKRVAWFGWYLCSQRFCFIVCVHAWHHPALCHLLTFSPVCIFLQVQQDSSGLDSEIRHVILFIFSLLEQTVWFSHMATPPPHQPITAICSRFFLFPSST